MAEACCSRLRQKSRYSSTFSLLPSRLNFLSEAGGEDLMMGDGIARPPNIQPFFVFFPYLVPPPTKDRPLLCSLLSTCRSSSPQQNQTYRHPYEHTHALYASLQASRLFLISLQRTGVWVSPRHLSTNKPRCLTWQSRRRGQSSQLSCLPRKTEKIIKYHLIRSEKVHSWSLPYKCPQAEGVGCARVVENYRGKLC